MSTNSNTDFDVQPQHNAPTVHVEGIPDNADASVSVRANLRESVRDADRATPAVAEVSTTVDPTSAHDSVTSSQDARDHAGDAGHSRREHDDDEEDDIVATVDENTEATPTVEAVADSETSASTSTASDASSSETTDAS